jgi:hypothetical protein
VECRGGFSVTWAKARRGVLQRTPTLGEGTYTKKYNGQLGKLPFLHTWMHAESLAALLIALGHVKQMEIYEWPKENGYPRNRTAVFRCR